MYALFWNSSCRFFLEKKEAKLIQQPEQRVCTTKYNVNYPLLPHALETVLRYLLWLAYT